MLLAGVSFSGVDVSRRSYVPNRVGGVDWVAVTSARMSGWRMRSFPEKRFHHYRSLGTAERTTLSSIFSYGEKDYYLGGYLSGRYLG